MSLAYQRTRKRLGALKKMMIEMLARCGSDLCLRSMNQSKELVLPQHIVLSSRSLTTLCQLFKAQISVIEQILLLR